MHFVGFIVRIYHDARSSECQISPLSIVKYKAFFLLVTHYSIYQQFH
jgi:hypothetical protein